MYTENYFGNEIVCDEHTITVNMHVGRQFKVKPILFINGYMLRTGSYYSAKISGFDLRPHPGIESNEGLYKAFQEAYGITIKRLVKKIIQVAIKQYIDPYQPYIDKYCRSFKGMVNVEAHKWVVDNTDLIRQCIKDGMENMVPILIKLNVSSVKEARDMLGKGLWKRLCANSFSRNKLLGKGVDNTPFPFMKYRYGTMNSLPTTVLKRIDVPSGICWKALHNAYKNDGKVLKKYMEMRGVKCFKDIDGKFLAFHSRLIQDTFSLCHQTAIEYNPKWENSYKTILKKHNELTEIYNKQQQRKREEVDAAKAVPYKVLDNIDAEDSKHGEYSVEWVRNGNELDKVGDDQKHCVGAYHERCLNEHYAVFVIKKKDKILSTVGLQLFDKKWVLDQHYGKCNSSPPQECVDIVKRLGYGRNAVSGGEECYRGVHDWDNPFPNHDVAV